MKQNYLYWSKIYKNMLNIYQFAERKCFIMYLSSHLSLNINAQIIHVGEADRPISSDYQFYLVQKGSFKIYLKDNTYTLKSSDIIMIPPDEDLICSASCSNTIISIRIDKSYIDRIIPLNYELICNSVKDNNKDYEQLADVMIRICSTFFTDPHKAKMISLIYEFTHLLQNSFIHNTEEKNTHDADLQNRDRINFIINFMHNHYVQNLTLSTLAKEMYLTPQYLSKYIKKKLGITFSAYLTNIRMEHAVNELLHTDHSVTDIAFNNGFSNITAFNKIFRQRYHVSPTVYRQKYQDLPKEPKRNNSELLAVPSHDKLYNHQKISISVNRSTAYQKPWQNTINLGPLSNALKNSFHEYFLEYKKCVSVKYIRFYNMFTEDLLLYDEETKEYNFSNLDVIIDFFYRNHVIPFVELRFKPAKGYVCLDTASTDKMFENEQDINYYYSALSAVLKHYLNKYGVSYMSQWRFEVWMKSDEDLAPLETPYQYAKKYEGFHKIIKELLPKCEIGGPGFNMSGSFKDFTNLLSCLEQYNVTFDFISVYAYCYEIQSHYELDDLSTIGIISLDANHIINNFISYQDYLRTSSLYKGLPVYITEFGSTVSVNNHISESVFQAAFLIKNMIGLSNYCNCVAYSYFIDSSRSFTQNTYSFSGLISNIGIPKPSLHAYTFLNHLGKNLISTGSNFILTSNSSNNYQLLCYNYTHFSKNYCFYSWDNVPIEQTYEIFDQEDPLNLYFSLEGILPGRYKVTQFSLNRNYGSVLDKYLRILEQGNISSSELLSLFMSLREDEARYYKQTAIPRQDIYYLMGKSTLELKVTLEPHEIILYEFIRVL